MPKQPNQWTITKQFYWTELEQWFWSHIYHNDQSNKPNQMGWPIIIYPIDVQRAEPMWHDTNAHRLYIIIRLIRKVRRRNDFTRFLHRISFEMPYAFHTQRDSQLRQGKSSHIGFNLYFFFFSWLFFLSVLVRFLSPKFSCTLISEISYFVYWVCIACANTCIVTQRSSILFAVMYRICLCL